MFFWLMFYIIHVIVALIRILKLEMYRNSVLVRIPGRFKDLIPVSILAGINSIPAGTEVIVANRTDLFKNISMLSLHNKIDVACHLLKD